MTSIRKRLLWRLLASIGLLLCVAAVAVYALISDEINEQFDSQLEQAAYTFSEAPLAGQSALPAWIHTTTADNPLHGLVVEVRRRDTGELVYHSHEPALLPADSAPGPATVHIGHRHWRTFTRLTQGSRIVVGQPMKVREMAIAEIAISVLLSLLPALPISAGLIWFGVGRGLEPLDRFATDVRGRSSDDLSPLLNPMPKELTPLAESLNGLMARLEHALQARKDLVSDAAHELLTPLTAIQLQAQLLARVETPELRKQALAELRAGLQRSVHLTRQLLTLARHDPEAPLAMTDVDLPALVRDTVATHITAAQARNINLGVAQTSPVTLHGDAEALRTLLSNLIDNAVKYTPANGQVDVSVSTDGATAILRVEDSGPGIPLADVRRVFDRFYRSPGSGATGSGLGLSIVRRIATRHGAEVTLHNGGALGGAVAACRFHV
ncbi:MAG: two-component sensor histidine kinase [Nevskiaceae bacterium]|nr:MAG: two-component sensor histidine kinase [Nevskiaceae bacterium]TBR71852.1 MAG: two-component sensor histidine kinase [Nevskiaceae bacterium]